MSSLISKDQKRNIIYTIDDTTPAAVIVNNSYNYDPSRVMNILMRKGVDQNMVLAT